MGGGLAEWVREHHPNIAVVVASAERQQAAHKLCQELPDANGTSFSIPTEALEYNRARGQTVCHSDGMAGPQKERGRPFFRKGGAQCGLTPHYPVPMAHKQSARALRSCADNVLVLVVSSTPVGGLLPPSLARLPFGRLQKRLCQIRGNDKCCSIAAPKMFCQKVKKAVAVSQPESFPAKDRAPILTRVAG
jgi:hypothetical protein